MKKSYDVTQSLFSAKAREGMLAFIGFKWIDAEGAEGIEGVLKIAAFASPKGSGYLTLTFLIDLEGDSNRRSELQTRFDRLNQDELATWLDPDFEMLIAVPLNTFAETKQFYIEELNLYFRRLAGREQQLLEEQVIPTLGRCLDLAFEPLEWLAEQQAVAKPPNTKHPDQTTLSLKQQIKYWLGMEEPRSPP